MYFNLQKHVFCNTLYAIFNITFIKIILAPFFRAYGLDAVQVSTLFTIQQFSWFIFLFVSGIVFDLFGAKMTFLLGRILEIISILLLLKTDFYSFALSMVIMGAGLGVMYGKYTSYIYNSLSVADRLDVYPRIASAYYFVWDIALAGMSYITSLVLKNHSYKTIIYMSLIMKVLAVISIIILIPSGKKSGMEQFKSSSVREIFISVKECINKNHIFAYLLLFYGLLCFFTYPLCLTIADMILVDKGMDASGIAKYTTFITATMAIGTILPIVFFPKGISVKKCVCLSIIQIFLMFIAAIIYNTTFFMATAGFLNLTLALIEVSIERKFEDFSNKKIRGSAISMSIAIGTLLTTLNIMLIGFVAKYFSYQIGLIVILIQILIILIFLYSKLKILTK